MKKVLRYYLPFLEKVPLDYRENEGKCKRFSLFVFLSFFRILFTYCLHKTNTFLLLRKQIIFLFRRSYVLDEISLKLRYKSASI